MYYTIAKYIMKSVPVLKIIIYASIIIGVYSVYHKITSLTEEVESLKQQTKVLSSDIKANNVWSQGMFIINESKVKTNEKIKEVKEDNIEWFNTPVNNDVSDLLRKNSGSKTE